MATKYPPEFQQRALRLLEECQADHQSQDAGITSSTGSIGDWYDNAMAETVSGLYKSEVIYPGGTWNTASQVELATMEWVDWWNNRRLHQNLGYATPAEIEQHYNETRESQAALVNT